MRVLQIIGYVVMVCLLTSPAVVVRASTHPQTCRCPGYKLDCSCPADYFRRTYFERKDVATAKAAPAAGNALTAVSAFDFGGSGTAQIGGMATDSSGNVFVAGGFWGSITFDTTPPTVLTSTGDADVYIAKFDPSGRALWAYAGNGAIGLPSGLSLDGAAALAVDASGNAYIGGAFVDRIDFHGASNYSDYLEDDAEGLGFEPFMAKYSPSGQLLWVVGGWSGGDKSHTDLTQGLSVVTEIITAPGNLVYAAGTQSGDNWLRSSRDPGDPNGAIALQMEGDEGRGIAWLLIQSELASVSGLALDAQSNLVVSGTLSEPMVFPDGTEIDPQGDGAYVAKMNRDFDLEWARALAPSGSSIRATHMAADAAGAIYVVGDFKGAQIKLGPATLRGSGENGYSGFLAKLDSAGNIVWARSFGQTGIAGAQRVMIQGNRVIVTGWLNGTAMFGPFPGGGSRAISSTASLDSWIATFDTNGVVSGVRILPGSGSSSYDLIFRPGVVPVATTPARVTIDRSTGHILLGGDYDGTLQLDTRTLTAPAGTRRAFVTRLVDQSRSRGVRR